MTRTVSVDVEGLNLILGGGVPVLQRHPEFAGESATLLVRGPPGAGKTVLGVQLAGSIARNLDAGVVHDVAYACVELLPSELEAQHAGIKRPEVKERVVVAPFVAGPRAADECRIFAEMLDIGKDGEEVDKLGDALDRVLAAIRERGGDPKVLVIDSLSDGYHLGSLAPRALADELCKMAAQQGLVLIMLEETVTHQPSAWSFACDLVIELSLTTAAERGALERWATIPKNRLGPCEAGPHRVDMFSGRGVQIIPSLRTYLRPGAVDVLLPGWIQIQQAKVWKWGPISQSVQRPETRRLLNGPVLPYDFRQSPVLVYGTSSMDVAQMASIIGEPVSGRRSTDIALSFRAMSSPPEKSPISLGNPPLLEVVPLGTVGALDGLVSRALLAVSSMWRRKVYPDRVFIGDCQRVAEVWSMDTIREPFGVLLEVFRKANIPTVLMESRESTMNSRWLQFVPIAVRAVPSNQFISFVNGGLQEPISIPLPPINWDQWGLATYLLWSF